MSSQIKLVAEHAKLQLTAANNAKVNGLENAVTQLKADVAVRDTEQSDLMAANAKAIAELESAMADETSAYEEGADEIITALTENVDAGIDSVKEVIDTLIAADATLDNSMLKWGNDAAVRKSEMIARIGDTVDVSAGA